MPFSLPSLCAAFNTVNPVNAPRKTSAFVCFEAPWAFSTTDLRFGVAIFCL